MDEENFEIFLKDFCDFLNSLEASIVKLKQQIAKLVGVAEKAKFGWNTDAIKWVEAEGFRGKHQRYLGAEQKAKSTSDYKAFKS